MDRPRRGPPANQVGGGSYTGVQHNRENDPWQKSHACVFAVDEDFGYRVHSD
jgi:hypothetical protein